MQKFCDFIDIFIGVPRIFFKGGGVLALHPGRDAAPALKKSLSGGGGGQGRRKALSKQSIPTPLGGGGGGTPKPFFFFVKFDG